MFPFNEQKSWKFMNFRSTSVADAHSFETNKSNSPEIDVNININTHLITCRFIFCVCVCIRLGFPLNKRRRWRQLVALIHLFVFSRFSHFICFSRYLFQLAINLVVSTYEVRARNVIANDYTIFAKRPNNKHMILILVQILDLYSIDIANLKKNAFSFG